MRELKFATIYRGKNVEVVIYEPMGAGGGFHINIDKRYYGVVTKRLGEWAVVPQHESYFTQKQKESILFRMRNAGLI